MNDDEDTPPMPFEAVPKPLRPMPEEERVARLHALGLGADLLPLTLTAEERKAAMSTLPDATTDPNAGPAIATVRPFIPPAVKKGAGLLAMLGGGALLVLPILPIAVPAWIGTAVFIGTSISGFLAGVAAPSFSPSKPVIPLAMVPAALSACSALAALSTNMPEGMLKNLVLLAAAVFAALAGKSLPNTQADPKAHVIATVPPTPQLKQTLEVPKP